MSHSTYATFSPLIQILEERAPTIQLEGRMRPEYTERSFGDSVEDRSCRKIGRPTGRQLPLGGGRRILGGGVQRRRNDLRGG